MSNDPVWDDLNRRLATGQPVDRIAGIDMVPEAVQEWAPPDAAEVPMPTTEAERDESVNADVLRRACHVRIDELIAHVRKLSPRACINTRNLALMVAQDLAGALDRYLCIERRFRPDR